MASDLLSNVPFQYAVFVVFPIILCVIQLYIAILINSQIKKTEEKCKEIKEQNDLLVKNILEMLNSHSELDKQHVDIESKNIELLEKLTDVIEKRG